MIKRSNEPFIWLLFSSGGLLAALMIPVTILLFGVVIPFGWLAPPDHTHLLKLLRPAPARAALLAFSVLTSFHAAHRFYFVLRDGLRLSHGSVIIRRACYGSAVIGSAFAGYVLLH